MSLHKAIPCPAIAASMPCDSSRKLRSGELPISSPLRNAERALVSQRLQVGASESDGDQKQSMRGYLPRSEGVRIGLSCDNRDGLQTTKNRSRKSCCATRVGGGVRA